MSIVQKPEGTTGRPAAKSLFYELSYDDPSNAVFTMKEYDHKDYLSFQRLYLEYTENDPTEYTFAVEVFGSWEYWDYIRNTKMLSALVDRCRQVAKVRDQSRVVRVLIDKMLMGKASYSEAKFLYDHGHTSEKPKAKKGKEDKGASVTHLEEHAERLGLINV